MSRIVAIAAVVAFVSPAWADEKEELAAAAKKLAEAKSYSFKGESKQVLPDFGGQGGEQKPQPFEGKHETGVATWILTDTQEIIRIGSKTASRPRAEWRVTDESERGAGGGRGRGMMGALAGAARPPRAPHEDLKDIDTKLEKATKAESKEKIGEYECDLYNVTLTEDAAKALIPGGGMMGRFGGGGAEMDIKGTGKVWVIDGSIVKFEVVVTVAASFQGNDFEFSTTRTTSIYDLDKTKVEVPEEAKKAIDKSNTK